jgi:hypothetical protein
MMTRIGKGLVAGLAATIVLSALMLLKSMFGLMPQLNAIAMLSSMGTSYAGLPATPAVGWLLHTAIGVVAWGGLFAFLHPLLSGAGPDWARGVVFSISAWMVMMVVVMPAAGAGLFGVANGIGPAIATLVLHVVFGAVLGRVYGALRVPSHQAVRDAHAYG